MTDKKYTDEEIIRALECHFNEELDEEPFRCVDCPLYNDTSPSCTEALRSYALDLIDRQKAEIEDLKENYTLDFEKMESEYDSNIKAEAYKEFAKRLENEINCRTTLSRKQDKNVIRIMHNLLKEMVGEEE